MSASSEEECVTEPGQQHSEGRKQGGGQLRGARRCRRRAPACLRDQAKQLAGAVAGLGRQVGLLGGRQVSLYSLCFLFFFLFIPVLCFEIVKILFNLGKT